MNNLDQGARRRRVVTVSGNVPQSYDEEYESGQRPRADYVAIADAANAELLDRRVVSAATDAVGKLLAAVFGPDVAMAWYLFRNHKSYDVVLTDGEQVGLPFAFFLQFASRHHVRHVMIAHRISARKKRAVIRLLGLTRGVNELLVYSTSQLRAAHDLFHRPGQKVTQIDFMVDTNFFEKQNRDRPATQHRPLLVTAGREFRDYPTLIDAVVGLDVDVVVASASPWSKREDNARDTDIPDNVTITKLSQYELRDLYDRADLCVVPLQPVDFQAGITTILEAMAMELPVICTATMGQIDVVVAGETGKYVGPGNVRAMREAITELLADASRRHEMGKAGRRLVEERAEVSFYARTIADRLEYQAAEGEWAAQMRQAVVPS